MNPKRRQRWDLSTDTVVENFNAFVTNMRLAGKRPLVEIVPESRTVDQNAMFFALYAQVAAQKQDESVEEIRRYCKLHFGVPILRRDDPQFRDWYNKTLLHSDYEIKKESMRYVPVTSDFSKKQGSEYIDEIIREYSQQGLCLTHPSEEYA